MGKFDGILICSDLDGTLLNKEKQVSKENVRAIEYFKQNGGLFTFITGRMPFSATKLYEMARANAPIGCINGGGIYDFARDEYVWMASLDKKGLEIVEFVDKNMPEIGIQICTPRVIYFSKDNSAMQHFREVTGAPNITRDYRDVEEEIGKVIFAHSDDEKINELIELLKTHPLAEQFDFIRSEHDLYELLPKGNSKGNVLKRMAEYMKIDMSKTIAVGDYDNDVSMIKAAGLGVAVANANPNAKAAADHITVSNLEHAIAKIIEELDEGQYCLI